MVTALIHFGLYPWSPYRTIYKKVSDCLLLYDDHGMKITLFTNGLADSPREHISPRGHKVIGLP